MNELKPCPFCGGTPSKVRQHKTPTIRGTFYYVECKAPLSKCGVNPKTRFYNTPEEAIEKWNRRVVKTKHKPQTNADRIRSMTDNELAERLLMFVDLEEQISFCKNLPECDRLLEKGDEIPQKKCMACLLEWLKQPAERD